MITVLAAAALILAALAALFAYLSYANLNTRWAAMESIILFGDAATDQQASPEARAEARSSILQLALAFSRSRDHRINNRLIARLLVSEADTVGLFAESKGDLKRPEKRTWIGQVRAQAGMMKGSKP